MSGFVKVAIVSDIEPGCHRSFIVGEDKIVIAHFESGFTAFKDECTHDCAPFGTDKNKLDDHQITCPRHGATYDIRSGDVTGPPALVPLEMYEVKIEGDDILIDTD